MTPEDGVWMRVSHAAACDCGGEWQLAALQLLHEVGGASVLSMVVEALPACVGMCLLLLTVLAAQLAH